MDLSNIKETKEGFIIETIYYKQMDNVIVGRVFDPIYGKKELHNGLVTVVWNTRGFPLHKNKGRTDLIIEV